MLRFRLALALGLAALPVHGGEPPAFETLFGERLAWRATETAWRPDGEWLTYFWKDPDGRRSLRALAAATGAPAWSLEFADLIPVGESAAIAPEEYLWAPGSESLLLVAENDLFLLRLAERTLTRLTRDPAAEETPAFSPDGKRIAFVRAADVWVLDLGDGRETRLTHDGVPDEILNGTTDWVYWEEIWNREKAGLWWSPTGRTLAFYRFDLRAVERYPLLDEREPYPALRWQRYPKAGSRNPAVSVGVVEVATGAVSWLDTGDAEASYLARVHWSPQGSHLAVERLSRDQTRLDLLLCTASTGHCRDWASQSSPTWVNLGDDFRFLADGGFLWSHEETGWRRLERHDRLGRRSRSLGPDGWAIDGVEALLGADEAVVVTAHRTTEMGAGKRRVARIGLADGEWRLIGDGDGWHAADVDPTGRYWLHEWSDADLPVRKSLESIAGSQLADLPGAPEWPAELAALPRSEFLAIPGPGGVPLPARLIRPAGFDPARRYPVVMYHYGGPGSQVVARSAGGKMWLWHRWLAARGYAVLAVDNEASAYFGKRGEDRLHRRFGPLELAAQLAAVDYLRTQSWADTSRLGLWGWSGGGANTLYSILHSPGTWKAAVAGAPVTDFRFYDTVWTERYLGTPQENPDGYAASSSIHAAAALRDALLVVHGTGDDNVHPQNTVALLERLVEAGLPFEDAIYPREKHTFGDAAWRHVLARMTEFLDRHLDPAR